MAGDVVLNKVAAIERAIGRVRQEHAGDDRNFLENQTRQDAIILNLPRACETSIDLAMHLVRVRRLGIPQETREAFDLLQGAGLVDPVLTERMKKMVGFRMGLGVQQLRTGTGRDVRDWRPACCSPSRSESG